MKSEGLLKWRLVTIPFFDCLRCPHLSFIFNSCQRNINSWKLSQDTKLNSCQCVRLINSSFQHSWHIYLSAQFSKAAVSLIRVSIQRPTTPFLSDSIFTPQLHFSRPAVFVMSTSWNEGCVQTNEHAMARERTLPHQTREYKDIIQRAAYHIEYETWLHNCDHWILGEA